MSNQIVLRGGRILDPATGLDFVGDIRIDDGFIAEIGEEVRLPPGTTEYRIPGTIVTPGLIDFHVHAYKDFTFIGDDPDLRGVGDGVTTVVDAGGAGAYTLAGFRKWVVQQAATRVLCYLNYSVIGIIHGDVPELSSPGLLNDEATLQAIEANRDIVKGIKVRACCEITGAMGVESIRMAKEVARKAGVPLAAHIGGRPWSPEDAPTITAAALDLLEEGDIVVHPYTPLIGGLFDREDRLIPQALEAIRRGVKFDVACGSFNVSNRLLRAGLEQGLRPDVISSDATLINRRQRVFTLPVVLSKFLAVGLPLEEVIAAATIGPARILGIEDEVGLKPGKPADISVLELLEGEWQFVDSDRELLSSRKLLSPVMCVRSGRVFPVLSSRVHPLDRFSAP